MTTWNSFSAATTDTIACGNCHTTDNSFVGDIGICSKCGRFYKSDGTYLTIEEFVDLSLDQRKELLKAEEIIKKKKDTSLAIERYVEVLSESSYLANFLFERPLEHLQTLLSKLIDFSAFNTLSRDDEMTIRLAIAAVWVLYLSNIPNINELKEKEVMKEAVSGMIGIKHS